MIIKSTTPPNTGEASSIDWLRHEFEQRQQTNPRYSLRSFAKKLGIGSGPLSEILTGKRTITLKNATKIALKLNLTPNETENLLALVKREQMNLALLRKLSPAESGEDYHALTEDKFNFIADWHHFALLALLETVDCRHDDKWLARKLGIRTRIVRDAIARLKRLRLIDEIAGKYIPTGNVTTTHDVPSIALRRFHRDNLNQAMTVLGSNSVEERDITSITMAIDPKKLPIAKNAIKRFRREMANLLESGPKSEVYTLSVQLIPITRKTKK